MNEHIKNDMTHGNVVRQLVRYAIPMVITSLLQAIYSIVDIIVAGHFIGGNGISAINNSSVVMNLITQIAIGFTVGGNVLMGQYFGRRDEESYKEASGTLLVFSGFLGIVSMAAFFLSAYQLLILLKAPALEDAVIYLQICAFGLPAIFGYNAISASLRALGNSRAPLIFIVISTTINVVLDLLFIAGFQMGVSGAAWGTLAAQYIAFIAALYYGIRNRGELGYQKKYLHIFRDKLKSIVRYGFPIALQMTIASISWLVVMVLINKYGVDVSAGNGVSNKIKDFCQLFITATTSAAATMAAQNLGAKAYERAENVMKTCMKITLLIAGMTILIAEIFAPQIVHIFSSEEDVIVHAVNNLRIEIIAQIFYAGFMSYNILATGCGDTLFVMANSFLNCIVVRLVLALVLQYFFGLVGVYLACMVAPAVSVPMGYLYYKSGKWKNSKT